MSNKQFADLMAAVVHLQQATAEGFARVDARLDGHDMRFSRLEARMDEGFDRMDVRFDRLESRVAVLERA